MKNIDSYKLYRILAAVCLVIEFVLIVLFYFFSKNEMNSTSIIIGFIEDLMLAPIIIFLLLARKSKN